MATQASDTSSKTRARGSSDELATIAQRAQAFTNASGTAIGLYEGSSDEMICRARSGAIAPDVGTTMRVEGSFTGLCIQSGKELRCDDTETDTRVDTTAIRGIGIRSLVVTPIKDENRVVGVLMVFAPTAHAFTITHVAVLKTMADQITAMLHRERKAKEDGVPQQAEPARPPAPTPVAMPKPVTSAPVLPPPVVIKPSASAAAAARTAAFPVVSKVEPIKTSPVAEDVAIQTPLIRKEDKRAEQKTDQRPGLGTFDAVGSERKKVSPQLMFGAAAAFLVVAAAAGTFAYRQMNKAAAPHPSETTKPASGQPASAAPVTGTQPGSQPAANSATVNSTATTNANPAAGAAASTGAANSAPKPGANSPGADATRKTDRSAATRDNNPAPPKASPTAVSVSAGTSRLGAESNNSDQANADPTPALTVGTGGPQANLSALTRPASSAPAALPQSDLTPVTVLRKVAPIYPSIARARRMSGTVTVQVTITKEGKIINLLFISGPPVFRDAAFEAVKQWQFKPAKLNGQSIEQSEQIQLSFNP
jgi:TonB family protein